MAKVKVWNDNEHPYEEEFKGEKIKIDPKSFIEMDYEEAIEFKGSFGRGPAPVAEDGAPDARYFKMIRVERPPVVESPADPLVNHLTGQRAGTAAELLAQLAAAAAANPALLVKDKDLDGQTSAKASAQDKRIAELEAQVAALVAATKKPGQGRPKGAVA